MNSLLVLFSQIRWQDAVDILLASYILFRFYVLFRGTYVFRVITGLALLWVFHRLTVTLGLIVSSWAIQGIMAAAALIIIVVFRNEIRSVLQAKNLKSILWGFPGKADDIPIVMIIDSVFELAQTRTGALIVLPGKEDLKEVVQSGILWGGKVSREMIKSIFWPDNPVHDGAAIIEGDQITEVGGILPLSRRQDLPSHYGTRHRAAIGLAESTDALVISISEERGNVSVAKGSIMRTVNRKDGLEDILKDHVGFSEQSWGYLSKQRLELGIAAVVSIVFIGAVWVSFTRGLDTLITLETPIEYTDRRPEMRILETSVNVLYLHLSGSGTLIRSLRPEQVKVRLDLSKAKIGSNAYTITQENIVLPPGVILKDVKPSFVEVSLDTAIKKTLPLQVDWVGSLPDNLILKAVQLKPDKLEVKGVKKILEKLSTIYTEKVPLESIKKSGTITVKPALNPASLEILSDEKEEITVRFTVEERRQIIF